MSQTPATLLSLLEACPHAQLCHSRDLYPEASGAGLDLIQVQTELFNAIISPYGAQLLSFTPRDARDLLWVSPNCRFEAGSALRGGIPLCLPWFGAHPTDASKPNHGFARNRFWELTTIASAGEECRLSFALQHPGDQLFAQAFSAELSIHMAEHLQLNLAVSNTSEQTLDCSWVLHSYFATGPIDQVQVSGLEGRRYLDKTRGQAESIQTGKVTFNGEIDRVYPGVDNPVQIHSHNDITIEHQGCPSVVVWNPGAELAARIGDIGPGNEHGFVCVERGACASDIWQLAPGEQRRASKFIRPLISQGLA